jgi:periplasmic divalent cation tolerance protein
MSSAPSEHRPATEPRLVLITAPDEGVAEDLARRLVESRCAACVNLVPGLKSVYRWEGAVQCDPEVLLLVKTTAERVRELEDFLQREHPYDTPECVALAPSAVEARYLAWWFASVGAPEDLA